MDIFVGNKVRLNTNLSEDIISSISETNVSRE